jgi:hypothetical protein
LSPKTPNFAVLLGAARGLKVNTIRPPPSFRA